MAAEFLRKSEWGREYGFLSELVHAWSPYDPPRDEAADVARLQSLCERVEVLLRQHVSRWRDIETPTSGSSTLRRVKCLSRA
jgi:hypothetical protein